MKNRDDEMFVALLISVMAMALALFRSEEKRRKRREEYDRETADMLEGLHHGFESDKRKLDNDWHNVMNDISKSYDKEKKKPEYSEIGL